MKLRQMNLGDVKEVHKLEIQCFTTAFSENAFIDELTLNAMSEYFVAEIDGDIAGYAGYWKILNEGHITVVCVNPIYRRRGIAKKLIDFMIVDAKKNYIDKMTLEVRLSNIPAQNLYKSMNFYEVGLRKKYYIDNNEDAVIMFADLV